MNGPDRSPDNQRRRFLVRCIQIIQGAMGATLALVAGRAVVAPALAKHQSMWLHAGSLESLGDETPTAVTLRIARPDGASEVVDRRVVYLVRTDSAVRAFDSTCTHLGCRTRYNAETNQIECPCHGGVYDTAGRVIAGPPPQPLAALPTRVEGDRVLVEV
jgi:succinate dehydrogenase / fumarate reductase iron-sulfur subunit